MGTLNKLDIARLFHKGLLIKEPRRKPGGGYDIQVASYDLRAGTALKKSSDGEVRTVHFDPSIPENRQAEVMLHPGEMMFVITYEEVKLPLDICGTVLPRNMLAREGILALNAGHVDPGFEGPIAIRLISLKKSSWKLKLGNEIFTIVFHTVDVRPEDRDTLEPHPPYSRRVTLEKYELAAAEGFSNALSDLNADAYEDAVQKITTKMNEVVIEHRATLEENLRKDFVSWSALKAVLWTLSIVVGLTIALPQLPKAIRIFSDYIMTLLGLS